jgi:acyl-CoA synthetase
MTALLRALTAHRVTVLAAVSTQMIMLLNAIETTGVALDDLRYLFTGGEAVPFERAARFETLTKAIVLQFYGSNEAGGLSYTTWRDSQDLRLRTAGRVIPEMNVTLVDPQSGLPDSRFGRPVCQGPLTSLGYFNDDAANRSLYTQDGFLKLEDIVRIDENGYLTVIGRIGDFIIRGGKNISAAAVEEGALMHPAIAAAAAVAMPDPIFGEKVCLYATLAIPADLTLELLVKFMQDNGVSKENCPERLIILDELPQVSGGKVAKQVLRDDIRRHVAAS